MKEIMVTKKQKVLVLCSKEVLIVTLTNNCDYEVTGEGRLFVPILTINKQQNCVNGSQYCCTCTLIRDSDGIR